MVLLFFKQKTAYEMRISDWSSDVCSSDLAGPSREAYFRALLEAAPDGIVITDGEGRIVLVNAQTEHLFGYPRDQLIGQPVEVLVPEALQALHVGHRRDRKSVV